MRYGFPAQVQNINSVSSSLTIFPSPNHGSFTLNISSPQTETASITITNILGEKIKEFTANTNADAQVQLDAAAGIYFVTAITSAGKQTEKIELQ